MLDGVLGQKHDWIVDHGDGSSKEVQTPSTLYSQRLALAGGYPVPLATHAAIVQRWGLRDYVYGLGEAACIRARNRHFGQPTGCR